MAAYHQALVTASKFWRDDPLAEKRIQSLAQWAETRIRGLELRYPLAEDWEAVVYTALYHAAYSYTPDWGTTFAGYLFHVLDSRIGPMLKTSRRRESRLSRRAYDDSDRWEYRESPEPTSGLVEMMAALSDPEARAVELACGFDGTEGRTGVAVGDVMGTDRKVAYKRIARGLAKLRTAIERRAGGPVLLEESA